MKEVKLARRYNPDNIEDYVIYQLRQKRSLASIQAVVRSKAPKNIGYAKVERFLANFLMKNYHDDFDTRYGKLRLMSFLRISLLSMYVYGQSYGSAQASVKTAMLVHLKPYNALRYFYIDKVNNVSYDELVALCDELFTDKVFAILKDREQHDEIVTKRQQQQVRYEQEHDPDYALNEAYKNEF